MQETANEMRISDWSSDVCASDLAHWQAAARIAVERFGRLDVLVNNAGIAWGGPPEEESLERWRKLMSVNLAGVFLGTRQAILSSDERCVGKAGVHTCRLVWAPVH